MLVLRPATSRCLLIASPIFALICLATVAVNSSAMGQALPPEGAGTWTTVAPAPTKRTEVAVATAGGKIYVIGGFAEPGLGNLKNLTISDQVEEYDPATDRWTTKARLPAPLHHAGVGVVGDRLYVIGGYTQSLLSVWHPVASVYLYHPATDSWSTGASMPTPRGALAVAEFGGKLYAIGGYDRTANSPAVELYDPAQNTWTQRAPLPTPRDHLAAATSGSRLYAIGGRQKGDYGRNLAVTESYDPQADRWTRVADLPTARSGITAGVIRGVIYVLGGEAPQGTFRTNEAYSPEADRWRVMAPMPTGRHGLGSATVNDRLYVIGGGPTPGGSYSNVTEVFLPPAGHAAGPAGGRASAQHVGTIMALLAAFQDAGALPPEASPEANRLIKALIQFQASLMKSANPAIQRLLTEALAEKLGPGASEAADAFRRDGWTSQILEAVVDHLADRPIWDQPEVETGFKAYNIGRSDLELLSETFRTARCQLKAQGRDMHEVYALRRQEMPGAAGQ